MGIALVRMLKQVLHGDVVRNQGHRNVIQGIVDKGASVGSMSKINRVIEILGVNMATSLDFDDIKKLLSGYKDTRKNFTDYQIEGNGTKINGVYYLIVPDEEIEKVHGMIEEIEI